TERRINIEVLARRRDLIDAFDRVFEDAAIFELGHSERFDQPAMTVDLTAKDARLGTHQDANVDQAPGAGVELHDDWLVNGGFVADERQAGGVVDSRRRRQQQALLRMERFQEIANGAVKVDLAPEGARDVLLKPAA